MDLVVDSNIIFAALIQTGKTEELLLHKDLHLYSPEFMFEEFNKHREYLLRKIKKR